MLNTNTRFKVRPGPKQIMAVVFLAPYTASDICGQERLVAGDDQQASYVVFLAGNPQCFNGSQALMTTAAETLFDRARSTSVVAQVRAGDIGR